MTTRQEGSKTPKLLIHAAVVVALGIMGDSLMYSLLPLEAENLGIPLTLVGLLLSANRLIRLVSNTWAGLAFERWGPRLPFVGAAFLALITTSLYGTGWGFVVFFLARAGWGVAWSAFRQGGYQAVWAAPENIKGRLMGIFWGIVRVGSAVSVVLGGFFYDQFSYTAAVGVVVILTALSIPAALAVRWPKTQLLPREEHTTALEGLKLALKTTPRRWILTVGFMNTLFEGTIVSTLSLYLFNRLGTRIEDSLFGIGTLAGILIAVRYLSNILFSPVLGSISDKVGQARMLIILSVISLGGIAGLVSLSGIWMVICLIPVFMAGAGIFATMNAASCELGDQTERPHLFVGAFSTAIDAGAAVSPLLAFSIAEMIGFETLYVLAVGMLVIACVRFWQTMKV